MNYRVTCFALLLACVSAVRAEPKVTFSPVKTDVAVGETFIVEIIMVDFPVSEGGGLTLRFKPSVIQVKKVVLETATWNFASQSGVIDNVHGRVSDILFSRFPGSPGNHLIGKIELEAIGTGRTGLRLRESATNPFAGQGQRLAVAFGKGKINARPRAGTTPRRRRH